MLGQRRTESAWTRPRSASPSATSTSPQTVARAARFEIVARYVRYKLGDARHERRVAQLASDLFAASADWHDLTRSDLTALRFAALLHDIGRHEDDDRHPEIGADLILRSRLLPLTPRERRLAAYAARYHRGAVPTEGVDDILLDGEYDLALQLLSLLRAADGLDSRVSGHAHVQIASRGRKLLIIARPEHDTPKSRRALARRKKFRLLEETLDCQVRVRVA